MFVYGRERDLNKNEETPRKGLKALRKTESVCGWERVRV